MDARCVAYYRGVADYARALASVASGYVSAHMEQPSGGRENTLAETRSASSSATSAALAYLQWIADWDAALDGASHASVKLNLGCGDVLLSGFVNIDNVSRPGVELVDLREAWPWQDGSVDYVRASHVIEHLPDKIHTMNELWRILKPGGKAYIEVPTTEGPGAWQDPTHVSFWNRRSFLYFEAGSPYRESYGRGYGIKARFSTFREQWLPTEDGPILGIVLEAVKE